MSKTTTFEAWAVLDKAGRFLMIGDQLAFYPSRHDWMDDFGARPVRVRVTVEVIEDPDS